MQELTVQPAETHALFTPRELVSAFFRHRSLLSVCAAGIVVATVAAVLVLPKYQASAKFLVKRDRVDAVISTAQQSVPLQTATTPISEQELNSEVQLLTSYDLLRAVVKANQLDEREKSSWWAGSSSPDAKMARAMRHLRAALTVQVVPKTNVVQVSYSSADPLLAFNVLHSLADFYPEKQVSAQRPPGQLAFFDQQVARAGKAMLETEHKLGKLGQSGGSVAPQMERDSTMQKIAELQATVSQTNTALAEANRRVRALQRLAASVPARITTQSRSSDNPQLLEKLKSERLRLELERGQLMAKYQANYRPVQENEAQLAEVRQAIALEENHPLRDETTDQNPTYRWIDEDLAKAQADIQALQARAVSLDATLEDYRKRAHLLNEQSMYQKSLLRTEKAEEDDYLLYLHKREESRISDALDERRMLNVALIEVPTVPVLPARPPALYGLLGFMLASMLSVGLVLVAEYTDTSFRTPAEVEKLLAIPVLTVISETNTQRLVLASNGRNGHGHGRPAGNNGHVHEG